MNGMQMMLKQFGIDPEELQKQLAAGKQQADEWLKKFDSRLSALEIQLTRIEGKLNGDNGSKGSERSIATCVTGNGTVGGTCSN